MYFWNIKQLREQLIGRGLGQRALFVYIFIYVVANGVFMELTSLFPAETATQTRHYVWALLNTAQLAAAVSLCFYFNGGAAGRQFAERYFSIGLVVALRMLALLALAALVLAFVFLKGAPVGESPQWNEAGLYTAGFLMTTVYYWRVITHINAVARARQS